MLRLHRALLAAALLAPLASAQTDAAPEHERSVLRVLLVAHDPANPREVSRWHMPGQHLAGGGSIQR